MRITHVTFLCLSSASVIQKLIKLSDSLSLCFSPLVSPVCLAYKLSSTTTVLQYLCIATCAGPAWSELVPLDAVAVSLLITQSPQPAQGFLLKSKEHPHDRNLVRSFHSFFLFRFSRVFFLTVLRSKRDIWSWRKEATGPQVDTLPAIITNPEIGIFTLIWMIRCKYKF